MGIPIPHQVWECLSQDPTDDNTVQLHSWQLEGQILAKLETCVSSSKEVVRCVQGRCTSSVPDAVGTEKQSNLSQDSVQTQGADTTRSGWIGLPGLIIYYH